MLKCSCLATAHAGLQGVARTAVFQKAESFFKRIRFLPDYGKYVDGQDVIAAFMGCLPDDKPDWYRLGSPLYHVGPHCQPTLLINGAHDFGLGVEQHGRLAAALRRANAPVVHLELPYTDHAFDFFFPRWNPAVHAAWYDTERFLALLAGTRRNGEESGNV